MAEFQFTEKEFFRASLRLARPRLLRLLIIGALAFALLATSLLMKREHSPIEVIGYCLIGYVLISAFFVFAIWRQVKRSYRQQAILQALLKVTIDHQQLSYTWERGSYVVPWTNIRNWSETPDFFFLYESPISVRILPKRALSLDETVLIRQKTEFRSKT